MQLSSTTANDGCTLAFRTSLSTSASSEMVPKCCILLLHGFSGSNAYFTRNFDSLSSRYWVVAPDMRGHGDSGRSKGGYHVARLAADLRHVVAHLQSASGQERLRIIPVGCSIGAAVLWTYVELFGCDDFAGFVFVDQGPLQDRSLSGNWDATRAHKGCYDETTLRTAQSAWVNNSDAAYRDLAQSSLGYLYAPKDDDGISEEQAREDEEFFVGISAKCDPQWLANLMGDHTSYDHREAAELIDRPTLVMYGKRSGCFTFEGVAETAHRVNSKCEGQQKLASVMTFESGHWLFYEEPDKFNQEVVAFVDRCIIT